MDISTHENERHQVLRENSHPQGTPTDRASGVRVLAVDDDPSAAKLLSLFLAPPAFRCTTACTAEEALVALQREPFDAIISDLQMPGLSGMELLTEVRHNHPHMAFLVTTGVDDFILLKPGPLTPEERKIMQRHAQIGIDLVKDIPFLANATDVILMHHERFDGSGYPQGLKGEAIPLSARIFHCRYARRDHFRAAVSARWVLRIRAGNRSPPFRNGLRSASGERFPQHS